MRTADLALIHAPSVFDFRKRAVAAGPISDMVPSTSIFEMYPMGFMTICNMLNKHGMRGRICNLALRMLDSNSFNVEKYLKGLKARMFGIDLHWLVHAHGALEVAKLLKKLHPNTPIVFGGLSSTYYADELIKYPFVDYVMRGDTTNLPVAQLVKAVKEGREPTDIPNLTYKKDGEVIINELSYVPVDLDSIPFDYAEVARSATRYMDFKSPLPYQAWTKEGSSALVPFRGCTRDCVICGGSCSAYRKFFGRKKLGVRSPERFVHDLKQVISYMRGPVCILGDVRMPGMAYLEEFLERAEKLKVKNSMVFELHTPVPEELMKRMQRVFPRLNMLISPESVDDKVRDKFGKNFDNKELAEFFDYAPKYLDRLDAFFMIGLGGQTRESVLETTEFCESIMRPIKEGCNIQPEIAPLGPFVDPGSRAFENPEEHGYQLRYKTLADHKKALESSSWKELLAYRTDKLSRDEIVDLSYETGLTLARMRAKYGLISESTLATIEKKVAADLATKDKDEGTISKGTIMTKSELSWPTAAMHIKLLKTIRYGIEGLFGK